ncbi:transcriptional regulator ATRX-like isoform 3-T3 [Sarcophilus harrisii]
MEHESINPLHSEENSDVLVTKSVSEGNVVVQPEPKKKEDKDDFQEPEVGHKSKMETKTSKRHVDKFCGKYSDLFQWKIPVVRVVAVLKN